MFDTNPVGKKVNLLKSIGSCTRQMTDEVCEIVSVVPWSQELNDWCQHYIVRGADGTEKEIREVDCVFSPDYELPEERRISDFLGKNGVYAEVWHYMGTTAIVVSISWGDWKHDHLWARDLMSYLGYNEIGNKVTEEDGSDTYSAEHYYLKNRYNDWQNLLAYTNEDLEKTGYSLLIVEPEEGFYDCEIYKDGELFEVYAENYYEYELPDLVADALHYTLNL